MFNEHNKTNLAVPSLFLILTLIIPSVYADAILLGSGTSGGVNSIAIGEDATALSSTADSDTNRPIPTGQVAIGYHAKATGISALALGAFSSASGFKSAAFGEYTKADGYKATAFGADSWALGDYSTATGASSQATGFYSNAYGYLTKSVGNYSTAIGTQASSFGINSQAIGSYAVANKDNSTALGANSVSNEGAKTDYTGYGLSTLQTSQGELSIGSSTIKRKITNVAAGENDSDAVNVEQLKSVNNNLTDTITFNANQAVNYGLNQDGTIDYLNLSLNKGYGNVVLKGVASGTLSSTSTEAVNGSQLYSTNERVSTLESSVADLQSTSATKTDLATVTDNLTTTQDQVDSNSQAITQTNTALADTKTQVDTNTQDIAQTQTDLTATNVKVDKNTQDIANTQTALADTNSRVDANTADIAQTKADLAVTNVKVDQNTQDISETKADLATTNSNLADTNVKVDKNTQDIASSTQDISKVKSDIVDTNVKVDNNTQAISELNDKSIQYTNDSTTANSKIALKGTNGTVISNVSDGVEATDAANIRQLNAVSAKITDTSQDIKNLNEGKAGVVRINNTSNKVAAKATGTDSVAIGQGSSASGANSVAVGTDSNDNGRANTVSVGNATTQRTISYVAKGVQGTDAVNVDQLNSEINSAVSSANAYADDLFSGMNQKLKQLERHNNAGIASAMAMATMPQAYSPGKSMVSMGVGSFQSESAISVGASVVSPEGKWVYKINGSVDSTNRFGAAAGVGYQW